MLHWSRDGGVAGLVANVPSAGKSSAQGQSRPRNASIWELEILGIGLKVWVTISRSGFRA